MAEAEHKLDLDAMEKVARACPAQSWDRQRIDYSQKLDVSFEIKRGDFPVAQTIMREIKTEARWIAEDEAQVAHIATFDPPTCLALIARTNAAEAECDRLREEQRDSVVAAYVAGATAVHENWQEDRDPEFQEAAWDYAAALSRHSPNIQNSTEGPAGAPPDGASQAPAHSELEPDERSTEARPGPDREGGPGRGVRGRNAVFAGRPQRSERHPGPERSGEDTAVATARARPAVAEPASADAALQPQEGKADAL